MLESMSKRYRTVGYSTISSEDFLKVVRNDLLANFDSQARNFSDQYVLDKIYKSLNPRNRRPQENAEIDRQIDALIENYNKVVRERRLKSENEEKFWFYILATACLLSFGVTGYIVADGIDAYNVNTLFNSALIASVSSVLIYKKGKKSYDLIFKKKEK